VTFPGSLVVSQLSTEYVIVPINAVFDGVTVNPTSDAVQFAFTTGYGILPSTWLTGIWDPNPVQGVWYNAKCLIGPAGTITLAPGMYTVWVKIFAAPETPVRQVGTVTVQ
jgi:hypothetical protein